MSFSLSVDAQEFVPGNGLGSSSKTKLCSSLSVDAPVFIPVIPNDSENSVEHLTTSSHGKEKTKPSAVQRRGRFAQVDCRSNSTQKSVDIYTNTKGPLIPPITKESPVVSEWTKPSKHTYTDYSQTNLSKEGNDKKKLKHSFSLEYAKRRKQITTSSFDEKAIVDDELKNEFKNDRFQQNFSSGESKPIVLWSSIVKKEPTDELIVQKAKTVEVSDEKPSKKYSKNKVTRTKNVLSDSTSEKFHKNLNEKRKRDMSKEEELNKKRIEVSSTKKFNESNKPSDANLPSKPMSSTSKMNNKRNNEKLEKQTSTSKDGKVIKIENIKKSNSEGMNSKQIEKNELSSKNIGVKAHKKDIAINSKRKDDLLRRQTKQSNFGSAIKNKKKQKFSSEMEKELPKEIEATSAENIKKEPEIVDMDLLDNSTFPALPIGQAVTPSVPIKSYSAAIKKVVTVKKESFQPNDSFVSSAGQCILDALEYMKLTEDEKRILRKRQKALKRKMKVKMKKQESKLMAATNNTDQANQNTDRIIDKEMTFDLSDMFSKLLQTPIDVKKSQKSLKSKKLKVSTGVISVSSGLAKKNTHDGRRVERNKYGTTHTLLDGTVIKKRGKERETPKKKRPTLLKKVIQAERERKRALLESSVTKEEVKNETSDEMEDKIKENVIEKIDKISELPEDVWQKIHSKKFREYCDHVIRKDINHLTYNLLVSLQKFQDRVYHENRNKYKQKRRFILGLREVLKHLKLKRLKAVVIAPNIERISAKGGLDDYLGSIISICNGQGIPKIFAMNRHVLGRVVKKLAPVSVIGIFDYDGAHETFKELVGLVEIAKEAYKVKVDNLLSEGVNSTNLDEAHSNTVLDGSENSQFDIDSKHHIKSQMLSKLCFNDYHAYDVESESDWVTDNESAPL